MSSCNHKSEFEDIPVDPKYLFNTDSEQNRMLKRCYKHKNEVDWFESCEAICNEFQPTDFNTFFTPRLKKFETLTLFLTNLNTNWEDKEHRDTRKLKSTQSAERKLEIEKKGKEIKKLLSHGRTLSVTDVET